MDSNYSTQVESTSSRSQMMKVLLKVSRKESPIWDYIVISVITFGCCNNCSLKLSFDSEEQKGGVTEEPPNCNCHKCNHIHMCIYGIETFLWFMNSCYLL